VIVKGQIFSREDLTIDGEVEGTVELQEHRLTVGPNGKVMASIKAREVVVLGTVHGNVETTDRIDIRKEAKLVGDIKTARIVIEDGAYFKGNIDIARVEASRPAAVAAPKPQQVNSVASPASPVMAAGAGDLKR
jgi:cytoskeletal protein CcmA (bactofilin family)